jgi:membrane fusion protein (multidrug efflux system)
MTDVNSAANRTPGEKRRFWFLVLGGAVAAAAILYGAHWLLYARYFESTDDAYVGGDIVVVTAREPATVLALHADNTQSVRRGQLLIEMDPALAEVNMRAAEAALAAAVRGVNGTFSHADATRAQLAQAKVALAKARADYQRREAASADGADVAHNPDVLAAEARLRAAAISLSHMRVVAPVDGVVAQRTVQAGQQVAAGAPLLAVVPLKNVWIDANFKEGQLERMRVGQPVTVTADIYGGDVTYHGRIEGLGAGSGSAFALLPPQNASGNWIKIVQRVPVRIALDPREVETHPLRVGLSVSVRADVRDISGALVNRRVGQVTRADTGDDTDAETDAIIARILRENGAAR